MPGKVGRPGRHRGATVLVAVLAAAAAVLVFTLVAPAASRSPRPIVGDPHGNHLSGSTGPDRINGGAGADRISGHGGADRIQGGRGFDRIKGGAGADTLLAGPGGGVLVGGPGRDEFNAVDGRPTGGAGRDVIRARDGGPDVVNCGPGRDVADVDRVEEGVFGCEKVVQPGSGQKRGGAR